MSGGVGNNISEIKTIFHTMLHSILKKLMSNIFDFSFGILQAEFLNEYEGIPAAIL
jgi:hypothetical protein